METFEALYARRSVRNYKSDPVPRADLEKILDVGRLAASGRNDQPWVFMAIDDVELKAKIAAETAYGRFIAQGGACIAIFSERGARFSVEDCSAACQNIMLAATALGYGSCWVNAHNTTHNAPVEAILKCPTDYELVILLALGVPEDTLPARAQKKPLSEVLRFNAQWE